MKYEIDIEFDLRAVFRETDNEHVKTESFNAYLFETEGTKHYLLIFLSSVFEESNTWFMLIISLYC